MKFLTKNFFRGILFLAPITLTIYIVYTVFQSVDRLGNQIFGAWMGSKMLTGIGFLLTIALIILAGYLSSVWIGSTVFRWIEKLFRKSPFVRGIYSMIREILHFFWGDKKFFSKVVLVSFPAAGYKKIGFVTQEAFLGRDQNQVVVYLPNSFQIAGTMIIVPKENIEILDMKPEDALKLILSGGIVER